MAVRKTKSSTGSAQGGRGKGRSSGNTREKKTGSKPSSFPLPVIFWLGFIILFTGLFLFNREAISSSIATIRNEIAANKTNQHEIPAPDPSSETGEDASPAVTITAPNPAPATNNPRPSTKTQPPAQTTPRSQGTTAQTTTPAEKPPVQQTTRPAAQTTPATTAPQAAAPQNTQNQAELRERALYFIHVDRGGSILRERVNRKIPVSASPMTDAIQAIISGPNNEEKNKGLISLIPPNTRILNATVRGDTAYISFSEEFQYNTYGVEGYAAQLRQIVFTATEFPNIKNVQILIEGRRVDYLGEGIWIGSPLNRDML